MWWLALVPIMVVIAVAYWLGLFVPCCPYCESPKTERLPVRMGGGIACNNCGVTFDTN